MSSPKRVRITLAQFTTMVNTTVRTVSGKSLKDFPHFQPQRYYDPDLTLEDAKFLVATAVTECVPNDVPYLDPIVRIEMTNGLLKKYAK